MNAFEFHCPTRIICGEHALHKLPVILVEMGVTKPLVVTDANLVALGITDHAIHRLTEAGFPFAFYDQVPPDSSLSVVNDVAAIYEQEGCDGFIAFGGGSVIDTTKGAAASISVGNRDIAERKVPRSCRTTSIRSSPFPLPQARAAKLRSLQSSPMRKRTRSFPTLLISSCRTLPSSTPCSPLPCRRSSLPRPASTHSPMRSRPIPPSRRTPFPMRWHVRRSRLSWRTSCALAKNPETLMCAPRSRSAACSQAPASRTLWWASCTRSAIRSVASAISPMARP